jgi:hypothetical protein
MIRKPARGRDSQGKTCMFDLGMQKGIHRVRSKFPLPAGRAMDIR